MRRLTVKIIVMVMACVGAQACVGFRAAVCAQVAAGAESSVVLKSLGDVAKIGHGEAGRGLPADFEATVTYFRSYERTLFVQDGEAAIYVNAATGLALTPGDRIRVRGTTGDSFRPIVMTQDVSLLQHGKPLVPVAADYPALVRSDLDCRYVKVRGKVSTAVMSLSSGRAVASLQLRLPGGYVQVALDSADAGWVRSLLGSVVEIAGVASGQFDGKMQQTGVLLHSSSAGEVRVLERPVVDPWTAAVTPMDKVLRDSYVIDQSQPVRVRGSITYYEPAILAVLQDGRRSIRVKTPQFDPLRVGDRAEAIGTPAVENGFLTLKLGQIRSEGVPNPVQPQAVNWEQLSSGRFGYDLVSIEGTVVTQVREHAQDVYIISAEGHLFSAVLKHPFVFDGKIVKREAPAMPEIRVASRVRVTGVAMLEDGNPYNGAIAFGIQLRSVEDVAVIAEAPWVNVRHLLNLVGGLLVAVLLVSAWGAMLRRKVQRQAAALALRTEAETMLERRRGRILEDINANRPLTDVLAQIAGLVSFSLNGVPCWLQISNGVPVGNCPSAMEGVQVVRQEVRSRSGSLHGSLSVGFDAAFALAGSNGAEALVMGAGLAALAIDTHRLFADLMHRSEFDLLTDVHNRFSLEKHLDAAIEDCRLRGLNFGLVYIDLNDFKQVNDRYGHHIGDLCLQQVAERMKRQLRPGDMLARLGGDEFAALVREVRSRAAVEEIAVRLERCFDEPFTLDGYTVRGSASLGISVFPENGEDHDALLSAADSAMYAAKHKQRRMETAMSFGFEGKVG